MLITLLALSGIKLAVPTIIIGAIYILCRILYTVGYLKGGPNWRIPGAMLNLPIILALIGMSLYSAIKVGQDGFVKI